MRWIAAPRPKGNQLVGTSCWIFSHRPKWIQTQILSCDEYKFIVLSSASHFFPLIFISLIFWYRLMIIIFLLLSLRSSLSSSSSSSSLFLLLEWSWKLSAILCFNVLECHAKQTKTKLVSISGEGTNERRKKIVGSFWRKQQKLVLFRNGDCIDPKRYVAGRQISHDLSMYTVLETRSPNSQHHNWFMEMRTTTHQQQQQQRADKKTQYEDLNCALRDVMPIETVRRQIGSCKRDFHLNVHKINATHITNEWAMNEKKAWK